MMLPCSAWTFVIRLGRVGIVPNTPGASKKQGRSAANWSPAGLHVGDLRHRGFAAHKACELLQPH